MKNNMKNMKAGNQEKISLYKKITCLMILSIILFSCNKDDNKKDLKIELLTNEIVCIENVKKDDFLEAFYNPNPKYDSLSKNILHYRIKNISDKKYFIMFNENSLGTEERDLYKESLGKKKYDLNYIGFSLYKNDSVLDRSSTAVENMCGNEFEIMKVKELDAIVNKFMLKNRIDKKYKLEYIDQKEESLQGYFLQPGETRYFTSIVNLPYRNDQKWISNIEKKKPNSGSFSLRNDSLFTKKVISENQKREIKENGYILFDGVVYSNRVPVKLIAIKK
ncbi:hypothetical protein [Flavobacterium sp. DG2-3]|uniref:hypothetical protein n=1 Tax=Flavobacterium sp. DG2-3 TaxID=3068317 RepID=UPI00273EEAAB|nr:hypothetical protein [Flavobacterium sp. DG2-3]MDP5199147.1 hypothetical protein [Flavobacterium sp. DG2-3]